MGGFVIMYLNACIDWGAGNVKVVPDSSHEAESAVAARAAKAGIFARQLLVNNGRRIRGATAALGDNRALFQSVQQVGASSRTRYYERAVQLFKRAVLLLIMVPHLVTTDKMIADLFTKAVERVAFIKFRNSIMNVHGSLRENLHRGYNSTVGPVRRLAGALYEALTKPA